jgi:formylglycine-generating enzyme required for sulfatase activity
VLVVTQKLGKVAVDELEPGDVLLSHSFHPACELISFLDWSAFSHAALWTGESVVEAVTDGVVERSLADSIEKGHRSAVVVYRRPERLARSTVDAVVAAARSFKHQAYPLSDVLLMAYLIGFKRQARPWDARGTARFRAELPSLIARVRELEQRGSCIGLTCSELVATAFAQAEHGRYSLRLSPLEGELLRGAPDRLLNSGASMEADPGWAELVACCERALEAQRAARSPAAGDPYRAALAAGVAPLRMVTPKDLSISPSLQGIGSVHGSRLAAVLYFFHPSPAKDEIPTLPTEAALAQPARSSLSRGRILFVAATPSGREHVGADKEWAAMTASLERSSHREQFELLTPALHASVPELAAAIAQGAPEVIHFAGHGDESGLLLVGGDDQASVLDAEGLWDVLRDGAPRAWLVVLNACATAAFAGWLAQRVPCAIGIAGRIRASEAQRFAQELYLVLGKGGTVRAAFSAAQSVLRGCEAEAVLELRDASSAERRLVTPGSAGSAERAPERGPRVSHMGRRGAWAVAAILGAASVWPRGHGSVPASTLVVVPAGTLHGGSTGAEARAAYDACLAQSSDDPFGICGSSFETSIFVRETTPSAPTSISRFALERHEVTNAQFAEWLNANRERFRLERDPERLSELGLPGPVVLEGELWLALVGIEGEVVELPDTALSIVHRSTGFAVASGHAQRPVRMVSFHAAKNFCAARGRRLPSAQEWEWAARGADRRAYPWGERAKSCSQVVFDRAAGHPCAMLGEHPQPVATSEDVTPQGIYDLAGNVSEWVDTAFGTADVKVVRGGHFRDPLAMLGGARIFRAHRAELYRQLGFRCAL